MCFDCNHGRFRVWVSLVIVFGLLAGIGLNPFGSPVREVSAATRTLYVSPSGSDSTGTGTRAKPWKTIGKSVTQAVAGDLILISPGTYAESLTIELTGTVLSPIEFRANGGAVIIDGTVSTRDAVFVTYSSYVILDGWTVQNAPRAGLRIDASDHVTVRNGTFANNGRWGVFTDFSDDLLIENNEAYGSVLEHGIYHSNSGDRPTIRGNVIHDNHAAGLHMNADESQGGDGIISGALVEGNAIYNNGTGGGAAINMDGITDSVVRNNLLYNNHASGIAVFQQDGAVCSNNNQFLNNTIVMASDSRWAITIPTSNCTNNKLFNNIFYTGHSYRGSISLGAWPISGFQSDYNVVMDRFTTDDGDSRLTLTQWQALGNDTHSVIATPAQLFVTPGSNFHLKSGSPAIDAGKTLANVTVDLEGIARPLGNGYDAGAFESGGSTATATATASPTVTSTSTRTPTRTPTAPATATLTSTPTATSTRTPTSTQTATRTSTPTATNTATTPPTATPQLSSTPTSTATASSTPSPTGTSKATQTSSPTSTATQARTPTRTATASPTRTSTPAPTATATNSPTRTVTATRTPSATATPINTATPVASPKCSVTPDSGRVGSKLSISCSGFLSNESVGVYWDTTGSNALAQKPASGGRVEFSVAIPNSTRGSHKAIIRGESSQKRVSLTVIVNPRIALSPTSGDPRTRVTVNLSGFKAGEAVTVRWYVTSKTTSPIRRSITVSSKGSASFSFSVPSTATNGKHKVEATGDQGTISSTTFTVTGVAPAAANEPTVRPTRTPRPQPTNEPTEVPAEPTPMDTGLSPTPEAEV